MDMKTIPTTEYGWIDYKDKVLIIKVNKKGNTVKFQFDGTSCLQGSITGEIMDEFETSSKWFNEDWWYSKTSWGESYPKKIYFSEGKTPIEKSNYDIGTSIIAYDKMWKETHKKAELCARPSENIIKAILKEVFDKTRQDYKLDFEDLDYGVNWYEAYVPLTFRGDKYLLTWMNCD